MFVNSVSLSAVYVMYGSALLNSGEAANIQTLARRALAEARVRRPDHWPSSVSGTFQRKPGSLMAQTISESMNSTVSLAVERPEVKFSPTP